MKLRVKQIAKLKGITLRSIAKEIGVHHQAITNYNNGSRSPNTEKLQQIAAVLDCPVHQLLEAPDGFAHFEDSETGEWFGIRKKE